jgi:hypothetical protein
MDINELFVALGLAERDYLGHFFFGGGVLSFMIVIINFFKSNR